MPVSTNSVIRADGTVICFSDWYAVQRADELDDPADCIPFEVCECPAMGSEVAA